MKLKPILLILALSALLFGALIACGEASTTDTSTTTTTTQDTTQPTSPPAHWVTTHIFSGNGTKKTGIFSAPDDWKILWKCNPSSFSIPYNVIVEVDNADSSLLDLPVNTTCKPGNTSDSSEEHQSGSVFLNITSEGDWAIQVQELK